MTTAQIMAVLSLLLAFNVPQKEVDTIQTMLLNAPPAQHIQIVSPPLSPTVPVAKSSVEPFCTDLQVTTRPITTTQVIFAPPGVNIGWTYVVDFLIGPNITSTCKTTWYVDYAYAGEFRGPFTNPSLQAFSNKVAGVYTVDMSVHSKDYAVRSGTTTISFTSPGIVTDEFNQ